MNAFGDLIRETRKRRGMDADELARALRRSASWVSDFELGKKSGTMPPWEMNEISRLLGIPMTDLLRAAGYEIGDDDDDRPTRPLERQLCAALADLDDADLARLWHIMVGLRDVTQRHRPTAVLARTFNDGIP